MDMSKYQNEARKTAVYPNLPNTALLYTVLGLVGEAGELANKAKKIIRGDGNDTELKEAMRDELGDVLWYVAMLAYELGLDLEDVAQRNLDKLADRAKRGKIKGAGDER